MRRFSVEGFKGGKGGGDGGNEVENDHFSDDFMIITTGVGEGPMYKVNPNGVYDIEINENIPTDIIEDYDTGKENREVFYWDSRSGTVNQSALPLFGEETTQPQTFGSAVKLKNGNLADVPSSKVEQQSTSAFAWDELRFKFRINALAKSDDKGNINRHSLSIRVTVFKSDGITLAAPIKNKTISGKSNVPFSFDLPIIISSYDNDGYRFTIEKTSGDSESTKVRDDISVIGWQEIDHDPVAYPRTAVIGYAMKAHNEYTGRIPTFTSVVKGLLVKVPSNYDQPILDNGDIDWRELEVPSSGEYSGAGYRQQSTGSTIKYTDATIYRGVWDGQFVYSWTQNPIWIMYDLLTNESYGLGIKEENIDKFSFYEVAQYCDACDPVTGNFVGVDGTADGTYRYKPRGFFSTGRETLNGLPEGTGVKERRFVFDGIIAGIKKGFDTVQEVCASMRAVLVYTPEGLAINIDKPNDLPKIIFNETNIIKDSFQAAGVTESSQITGVDVAFVEPNNHYKREVLRINDDKALLERNMLENVISLDLFGVTRRSQAIRFAQYMLAANKYLRRVVNFQTDQGYDLVPGDVIAVQQKYAGTNWGFGGKIRANSSIGTANVYVEHFSSPAITTSTIQGNTAPLALRVTKQDRDQTDLYLLSNVNYMARTTMYEKNIHQGTYSNGVSYTQTESKNANVSSGFDALDFTVTHKFNKGTKQFDSFSSFDATTQPVSRDLWNFGEVNPADFYSSNSDKLFKITEMKRDQDELTTISAVEYISNVYTDSDTVIAYKPVKYKETFSPLGQPPVPILNLDLTVARNEDESIRYDLIVDDTTERSGYPIQVKTYYEMARPDGFSEIEGLE